MDTGDAAGKLAKAETLYREERFEEAYGILAPLEHTLPGDTDVLFRQALCLDAMGRGYEARLLLKRLQSMSGDGPWTPYLAARPRAAEATPVASALDEAPHSGERKRVGRSVVWAVVAGVTLIALCSVAYFTYMSRSRTAQPVSVSPADECAPAALPIAASHADSAAPDVDEPDDSPSEEAETPKASGAEIPQYMLEAMSNTQLLSILADYPLSNRGLALLGQRITADDTAELCRRVKNDRVHVRRVLAARLIGYKHLLGGSSALTEALRNDKSQYVRRDAARSLGRLEQRRGAEALQYALINDSDTMVRKQAAWALRQVLGREAIPVLTAALQTERSSDVRLTIQWMMDVDFKSTRAPDLIPGQPVCGSHRGMFYRAYLPTGKPEGEKWPLIVSVHGTDGSPDAYLDMCVKDAEKYGIVVIAPYFDYPVFPMYDLLNIDLGMERSDLAILDVIDTLAERIPLDTSRFYLFGHSKGGQFVSRFVMAHADRLIRAVAGSPGNYVMPDAKAWFPYGTKPNLQAPDLPAPDFGALVQTPLLVLVGEKEESTRHDLAKRFVSAAQGYAHELHIPCRVKYLSVPKGVHAGTSNYPFASRFLYQGRRVRPAAEPTDAAAPR